MLNPWCWSAAPARLEQPVALLRLDGPDSLRFLHGQSSQDLVLARPGAWCSTCCITPTARLRALAEVLVDGSGAWLVITAGGAEAVRQALDRVLFPADAVQLGPLQPGLWLEPVEPQGPGNQADAVAAAPAAAVQAGAAQAGAAPQRNWESLPAGQGWRLGRAVVLGAGAPMPAELAALPPLSDAALEWRRIALGLPAAAAEINDDTNPFELGLADRVSLSKGCYVGQETLARLATYDGVKQQLRRWFAPAQAGRAAPAAGTPLRGAAGERAGSITTALALPGGAGWIGLALVRRAALAQQRLWLGGEDGAVAGEGLGPGAGGVELLISMPETFVAPPVAGGGAAKA
jgi:folate-binding protein YgfZ